MGEWHKVEPLKDDGYPCRNCEMASASYSSWVDPITDELWVKTDACQETCELYKKYMETR